MTVLSSCCVSLCAWYQYIRQWYLRCVDSRHGMCVSILTHLCLNQLPSLSSAVTLQHPFEHIRFDISSPSHTIPVPITFQANNLPFLHLFFFPVQRTRTPSRSIHPPYLTSPHCTKLQIAPGYPANASIQTTRGTGLTHAQSNLEPRSHTQSYHYNYSFMRNGLWII